MAITEDSTPSNPISLGRQVSYTVSSNDIDIVRMKGSVDIDSSAVIILDPDIGETNEFTFDFQTIVERNLGGYMTVEEGGHGMPVLDAWTLLDADEAFFDIIPTFIELVGTVGGGLVEADNLVGSTTAVINAFLAREQSQNMNEFNLNAPLRRFLTNNSPNSVFPITSRNIRLTDNAWLSGYTTNSAATILLEVAVTNTSNVTTVSFIDLVDLQNADRGDIPVGPINLNAATLTGDSEGSQPIINSTTKSYTVTVVGRGNEQVTNGDFSSSTGWTLGGSWVIAGGVATNGPTSTSSDILKRTLSLSTNTEYFFSIDKVSHGGDFWTLDVDFDNTNIISFTSGNSNKKYFRTLNTAGSISNQDIELNFKDASGATITMDNVSITQRSVLSETITFELYDRCFNKEVVFFWENRFGGLDGPFVFQTEERGITVDKKTYIKPLTNNFTTQSRGRTTIGGESNTPFSAFSTALKDNELIWLEEIFEDRLTFILVNGEFIPVTVTRNSAKTVQEGLNQLRIDYTYANNRIILGK